MIGYPVHPQSLGRLWELSGLRISVLYGEVTATCVLCTEETKEIQVVSEEELQRDSLALPEEPGREQEVEGDRQVGGKGNGEPGELGQIPQVPAALLASQENQEAEGPERDQLVIRDGQEEGQDADEEGG